MLLHDDRSVSRHFRALNFENFPGRHVPGTLLDISHLWRLTSPTYVKTTPRFLICVTPTDRPTDRPTDLPTDSFGWSSPKSINHIYNPSYWLRSIEFSCVISVIPGNRYYILNGVKMFLCNRTSR